MNTEDLKELITNTQRRRFERAATEFAANPAVYKRRENLDDAADAYDFIRKMKNDDFENCSFEDQPIGKVDDLIDLLVSNSKKDEEKPMGED